MVNLLQFASNCHSSINLKKNYKKQNLCDDWDTYGVECCGWDTYKVNGYDWDEHVAVGVAVPPLLVFTLLVGFQLGLLGCLHLLKLCP